MELDDLKKARLVGEVRLGAGIGDRFRDFNRIRRAMAPGARTTASSVAQRNPQFQALGATGPMGGSRPASARDRMLQNTDPLAMANPFQQRTNRTFAQRHVEKAMVKRGILPEQAALRFEQQRMEAQAQRAAPGLKEAQEREKLEGAKRDLTSQMEKARLEERIRKGGMTVEERNRTIEDLKRQNAALSQPKPTGTGQGRVGAPVRKTEGAIEREIAAAGKAQADVTADYVYNRISPNLAGDPRVDKFIAESPDRPELVVAKVRFAELTDLAKQMPTDRKKGTDEFATAISLLADAGLLSQEVAEKAATGDVSLRVNPEEIVKKAMAEARKSMVALAGKKSAYLTSQTSEAAPVEAAPVEAAPVEAAIEAPAQPTIAQPAPQKSKADQLFDGYRAIKNAMATGSPAAVARVRNQFGITSDNDFSRIETYLRDNGYIAP